MKQHKAAVRNHYMSYLTTARSLDTGHQVAFDEAQIIGQAQYKAGRLFMATIYSDDNSINRHTTLDPCHALIKDRLTRLTVFINYKNSCTKIYKRWRSGLATLPTEAPPNNMNVLMTPSIDNNLPLKTPIFIFIKWYHQVKYEMFDWESCVKRISSKKCKRFEEIMCTVVCTRCVLNILVNNIRTALSYQWDT